MMDSAESPPPLPPVNASATAAIVQGLVILAAGVALIGVAALLEDSALRVAPLANSVVVLGAPDPWGDSTPVRAREVPEDAVAPGPFLEAMREEPGGQQVIEQFGLDARGTLFYTVLDDPRWPMALASGRLPEPGQPEVLAGVIAQAETFVIDGTTFEVVGRLHRTVSAFGYGYVLPESPEWDALFSEEAGGETGWLSYDAFGDIRRGELPGVLEETDGVTLHGGRGMAPKGVMWLTLAGLALVAVGGAMAQVYWLRSRAGRAGRIFNPGLEAMAQHGTLLLGVHLVLYGFFFGAMLAASYAPLASMRLMMFVGNEFREGDLSFIGEAYASGNVIRAAFMTWLFNFGVATVLISVLPSFVVPGWALFKNALTFAVVGFAMAPIWLPSAGPMTYHSITMTLELQAYVYVSFGAVLFPYYLMRGLSSAPQNGPVIRGVRVLLSTTAAAGVLLAIAAFYEAATLIAFMR